MTINTFRDERAALRARIIDASEGLDALRGTILADSSVWSEPSPTGRLLASVLRQIDEVRHGLR